MADANAPDFDSGNELPIPPIAAAFLVNFDHRKGYTLAWQQSIDGVQVEGAVEFKSLPSGLHNVEEDLIYFVHDEYAGLSAFLNQHDEQSERKARMLAIGVLVPLERGRMGKIWRHAEALKDLTRSQIQDVTDTAGLEQYWEKYRLDPDSKEPVNESSDSLGRSNGYRKSKRMSIATNYFPSTHHLSPHHPASTLLSSIRLFGPLIFPVLRAALLRKRILIVTEAPVEFSCNLVYNISILSSISSSLLSILPTSAAISLRLRPLFTVGVADIDLLKKSKSGGESVPSDDLDEGWIACTTDDVLSTKPDLFDLLVLMPSLDQRNGTKKVFPRIVVSTPALAKAFPKNGIKSTQRDFHRYVHLEQGLQRFPVTQRSTNGSDEDDGTSSISSHSSSYSVDKAVVEPPSWSRVAYTSLVWWASAGDRRGGFAEMEEIEMERDTALLHHEDEEQQIREVALVAYFHRMTASLFETISAAIVRTDGESLDDSPYQDEPGDDRPIEESGIERGMSHDEDDDQALLSNPGQDREELVEITQDDLMAMGLDSWSAADKMFVEDFVSLWWGRGTKVRAAAVECCGLRIL